MKKDNKIFEKKKRIFLIGFLILFFIVISGVSADNVCCYNPTNGICTKNVDESSCVSPAEVFANPQCTNSKCNEGCCILGTNSQMTTPSECQILSNNLGMNYNFQLIDAAACTNYADSEVKGACIVGEVNKQCQYTTSSQCSGDFRPGVFCCNPTLNLTCTKTTKTKCYDGDVYFVDTCNQVCEKKDTCSYDSGFICEKKSITEAQCKSINCENGKKNGDSWCFYDGTLIEEAGPVGSRFFKQMCINGNVETEPCADYRLETCDSGVSESGTGEAQCKINPYQTCLAAENDSESCNTEYCKMWPVGLECNILSAYGLSGSSVFADCSAEESGSTTTNCPFGLCQASTSRSVLFDDLHLEKCLPLIQGGIKLSTEVSEGSSTEEESVCSAGDYSATLYFDHDNGDCNRWRLKSWDNPNDYINQYDEKYGYAGVIDLAGFDIASYPGATSSLTGDWYPNNCEENGLSPTSGNPVSIIDNYGSGDAYILASNLNKLAENGSIPDQKLMQVLEERCRLISDCDGKSNWVGAPGGGVTISTFYCHASRDDHIQCDFNFKCSKWQPPESGECEKCGNDGLPCSEYRCKSLGGSCEYETPDNADRSYCFSSSDTSAPTITLKSINPNPPIPPYTAAEFVIETNKDSECKFNLDNAGAKFQDMNYYFGNGFGKEHRIVLNVPGQTAVEMENGTLAYALMNQGSHTLYVRCLDAGGHGKVMNPFEIKFQVMQNPDNIAPIIKNETPKSGSPIKFNTTEKTVEFSLNEPSECKWDYSDINYSSMRNNLSCETAISDTAILRGYYICSGKLTNITTILSGQTEFYVKCKDQPWLQGNENSLYHRNTNSESHKYILRHSEELKITEVSPVGDKIKSISDSNIELKAVTSGGGFNGKAVCSWRKSTSIDMGSSVFVQFSKTNSNSHKQNLTGQQAGTYYVDVKCTDSAENIANISFSYNLILDTLPPVISRIFRQGNDLKLITNEVSKCFVSFNPSYKCAFLTENSTRMSGSEKAHTTNWEYYLGYYIRCGDYFGNENDGACSLVARTTAINNEV